MTNSASANTVLFAATGGLLALVGAAAVFWIPERMHLVLYVRSAGANEVVIPFAYWAGVGAWTWALAGLSGVPIAAIAARAVCVGIGLHVLVLASAFTPRLAEAETFSTQAYWAYAKLYCGTLLAGSTAWTMFSLLRGEPSPTSRLVWPLHFGWAVLAVAFLRADVLTAVVALTAGLLTGFIAARPSPARVVLASALATLRQRLSRERVFLFMVFVLAMVIRVAYLRRVMSDPGYLDTGGDGFAYDAVGWSIARGDGVPPAFRTGYPLLLLGYVRFVGAVYAVVGHSYFLLGVVQSTLSAAACLLLYRIGRELFNEGAARVAAVFAALSFLLTFAAVAIGHQALDVFVTIVLALALVRAVSVEGASMWRWMVTGVVLGVAIAVRETSAPVYVLLLVWVPFALRRTGAAAAKPLLALTIGVGLVLAPLVVPMVQTSEKRLALRQHLDRLYRGQGDTLRTRGDLVGPFADPSGALTQLRERPGLVIATVGRSVIDNISLQFFSQPFGGFDLVFLSKGSAYYYGLWFYAYAFAFAFAGALGAMRAIWAADARAPGLALILGLIVVRALPHVVLESHYFHRVPLEPFLILLAASACVGLVTAARRPPVIPLAA